MSKPWGKIGAWAAEAEREEEEERAAAAAAAAAEASGGGDSKSFPSLKEAVNTKQKKKVSKMSLQEFYGAAPAPSYESRGLTPEEMCSLPTGPKERSEDELRQGRLGGGFSSYGAGRSSGNPMGRDGSWTGNRRSYGVGGGGFEGDDDRRGPPSRRLPDYEQPSKADEVDNWASTNKFLPSSESRRPNRYDSLGGGGVSSRADEADNWAAAKKPVQPRPWVYVPESRRSEPDRWGRGAIGDDNQVQERRKLVLDPPKKDRSAVLEQPVKTNKPNPFGDARPREEILAEKGLDWKKLDSEIEAKKTSRPTSSQSSRPESEQSSRSEGPTAALQMIEGAVKPRPKFNPFGDAKPREVLLEEKGLDWRKIDLDLEHRSVDRTETEAEKILKTEIEHLRKELEKESSSNTTIESFEGPVGDQINLRELINRKERELQLLTRELDDKVRFGQKVERPGSGSGRFAGFSERPGSGSGRFGGFSERPGSGSGRFSGFSERPRSGSGRFGGFAERPGSGSGRFGGFYERPPSYSGSFEETRSVESFERPRSPGMGDAWAANSVDRRDFKGNRDGAFLGNRETQWSASRERW